MSATSDDVSISVMTCRQPPDVQNKLAARPRSRRRHAVAVMGLGNARQARVCLHAPCLPFSVRTLKSGSGACPCERAWWSPPCTARDIIEAPENQQCRPFWLSHFNPSKKLNVQPSIVVMLQDLAPQDCTVTSVIASHPFFFA